ncbi:hypothetical protein AVEN_175264-1 [Araneus ventricosus]|uniref:Uncharacterized protein n=1 Tax=Araneus ventricosus TaxID=182803 RepID=A0A4Y2EY46_ARAVE|nr:hypothetical protein AVEN_175264-1 [Araneus ventricosus]
MALLLFRGTSVVILYIFGCFPAPPALPSPKLYQNPLLSLAITSFFSILQPTPSSCKFSPEPQLKQPDHPFTPTWTPQLLIGPQKTPQPSYTGTAPLRPDQLQRAARKDLAALLFKHN